METAIPVAIQPLDEAWRLRHHLDQPPLYRYRFQRMTETLAFIQYGRERGRKGLDASSPVSDRK